MDKAEGLPLYVYFIIEDIKSGNLKFPATDSMTTAMAILMISLAGILLLMIQTRTRPLMPVMLKMLSNMGLSLPALRPLVFTMIKEFQE